MAAIVNRTHIDMAGTRHPTSPMERLDGNGVYDDYDDYEYDYENAYDELDESGASFDLNHLHHHSTLLRQKAVNMLSLNPRRLLFLQGSEYLRARDLVDAAAAQYDLNGEEYCDLMRKESYWGGGPEIVALCNVLRRPIHVYELTNDDDPTMDYHHEQREVQIDEDTSIQPVDPKHKQNSKHDPQQFRLRRMACFGSPNIVIYNFKILLT